MASMLYLRNHLLICLAFLYGGPVKTLRQGVVWCTSCCFSLSYHVCFCSYRLNFGAFFCLFSTPFRTKSEFPRVWNGVHSGRDVDNEHRWRCGVSCNSSMGALCTASGFVGSLSKTSTTIIHLELRVCDHVTRLQIDSCAPMINISCLGSRFSRFSQVLHLRGKYSHCAVV